MIEIYDDNGKILYSGPLTGDRLAVIQFDYVLSFIPKEIPFATWVSYLQKELRAKVTTTQPCWAEDPKRQTP